MKNRIFEILNNEIERQKNTISLIASENITSKDVRKAAESELTNKYAEGYPGRRYYSGCQFADEVENVAIDLLKKIFNAKWANVQPHSGSQANQAVFFALLNPGDTILSLSLESGGHLTHGAKVSSVSSTYKIVHYTIDENGYIDMVQVERLAKEHKPQMIITGASAYPRAWDWKRFSEIAKEVGAYLLADVAHTSGLIAGGVHENPIEYVDIMTSTTHKILRGPRGGIIFSKNEELGKKIDKALFPGVQGGPLMHIIAAKAMAFAEILGQDEKEIVPSATNAYSGLEYKNYAQNVLDNAQILANTIIRSGGKLVTDGTDNHLMIVDCKSFNLDGKGAQELLEKANIWLSVSALVSDTSWIKPSGIRIGTPYITTLGIENMQEFSDLFVDCLATKKHESLLSYVQDNAQKLYKKFL